MHSKEGRKEEKGARVKNNLKKKKKKGGGVAEGFRLRDEKEINKTRGPVSTVTSQCCCCFGDNYISVCTRCSRMQGCSFFLFFSSEYEFYIFAFCMLYTFFLFFFLSKNRTHGWFITLRRICVLRPPNAMFC